MARDTRTGGREATTAVIPGSFGLSVGDPGTRAPAGFAWRALSDLARLESGHTPSRNKPDYWDGDIPWIGIRDASGNHGKVLTDTEQHVTQLGLDNSSARLLPSGTVCLSRTASVGYVVTMGRPMATSQDFVNWVCGPELDHRHLHYLLMAEQDTIRRIAYGSVHPTMYYPDAKALHVCIPSIHEQVAIADVLGALDDKIAANERAVDIADNLVRVRYEALSGDSVALGNIATNVRDQVDPKAVEPETPYVGLEHVPRRSMWLSDFDTASKVTSAKAAFRAGDVLFGKLRPYFHKVVSAPFDGIASTDILVLRAKRLELAGLVLAAASSDGAIAATTASSEGTRMPRTKWADLAAVEVPWPGDDRARRFSGEVSELADWSATVAKESQGLAATRDELLPLLMSGKLRVRDAEKSVEGVL